MTTKLIATIIRFICIGILLAGGFYFGQRYKECPQISEVKPKIEFMKGSHNIVQEVIYLSDSAGWCLITTVWSDGKIIRRNHVFEQFGTEVWHKGNLRFVPKITYKVKKSEHERAQRALDEHLEKLKPYEPTDSVVIISNNSYGPMPSKGLIPQGWYSVDTTGVICKK